MLKSTWEKVFEYASMPVHGTLSRKLRKDVKIQINEGKIYEDAVIFLGEEFARVTEKAGGEAVNTYYDWEKIACIRTYGKPAE
ncbi:MAG: hypothetical protein HQK81_07630 [Desulfovibrionaceae bacterium]|nr:hypothetical protein [Desulfovibrionaceae bacterium]MBF0513920.1 hypothetical protein [Desulfovibrionaceae bacterium]